MIEGQTVRYILGAIAAVSVLLMVGGAVLTMFEVEGAWAVRCALVGGITLVATMIIAR
ncbi:MAG: hypothetical protein QGI24_05660 [Kiritimatiellia bacterium]|jgi:hypothetical protein|nr:hypothetical protein [Kiritimatiellia bacterium]MDP6848255.1 hypothetical protein [Kiritimatiellia bacterium]